MATETNPWSDTNYANEYNSQAKYSMISYLVTLRELAKACNFCSEECICAQKNIRDQIIECINDGDTVKHLLRQPNLTDFGYSNQHMQRTGSCKKATQGDH